MVEKPKTWCRYANCFGCKAKTYVVIRQAQLSMLSDVLLLRLYCPQGLSLIELGRMHALP